MVWAEGLRVARSCRNAVNQSGMRLLLAVEGSVLWLQASPVAAVNLRREAAQRGVAPERLLFAPRLPAMEDHLARYALADLFLDTLPFNAHTTAADALWSGLPVLTCLGEAFAGRVAASLLYTIGLPELVAKDLTEYEALALKLAADADLLGRLRTRLAANRENGALFDLDRFRLNIESAYLEMWQRSQRGEPPASFTVEPSQTGAQAGHQNTIAARLQPLGEQHHPQCVIRP